MGKELFIQTSDGTAQIALLEDRRLIELHHENLEEDYLVGDLYIGKVKKLAPGLNAAFVDIGHDKDAFLHYHDLGPDIRTFNKFFDLVRKGRFKESKIGNFRFEQQIVKSGKMEDVLQPGMELVVQIMKEPIGTKGHRLTTELSLSGRYLILMPFKDSISVSKKIKTKEERDRLRHIVDKLKQKNFGFIVRTNAEECTEEELAADHNRLMSEWDQAIKGLQQGKRKLHSEVDRTSSLLRDIVNESFSRIVVDREVTHRQLQGFLRQVAPDQENILKLYRGDRKMFEHFDIERQIRGLFNKIVNLSGGAYIIIEHTEAMHVVDVNSGSKRSRDDDQEENALRTNLEAAEEISRQLRLRDMGGIVVIDFIDMRQQSNRKQVYERMKQLMKLDRAKNTILPLSKFGLMQITRQRVRQEIKRSDSETCPLCGGTGVITKGVFVGDDIQRAVEQRAKEGMRRITLTVHPYVHAYLTKGIFSQKMKWRLKHKIAVNIVPKEDFLFNQYEIKEAA